MKTIKAYFILFYTMSCVLSIGMSFNCTLPPKCQIGTVHLYKSFHGKEKNFNRDSTGIRCDINERNFEFGFNVSSMPANESCLIGKTTEEIQIFELKWNRKLDSSVILGKSFGIKKLFSYLNYIITSIYLNIVNANGFELDFDIDFFESTNNNSKYAIVNLLCVRCQFNFYKNGKSANSCKDIGKSSILSIFQFTYFGDQVLGECEFKETLCPLVFKNSKLNFLIVTGLIDSFYKKSILRFSNETFSDLNSIIYQVEFFIENVNIDSQMFHPSVFEDVISIILKGSVNSIDPYVFKPLTQLLSVGFETAHFRKLIHKNGIEWIKQINNHIHVNLSDYDNITSYFYNYSKTLILSCEQYKHEERMSRVFPDEDFCIYKDYPFDQLVLLFQVCNSSMLPYISTDFSCTYLWLTEYIVSTFVYFYENQTTLENIYFYKTLILIRNSNAYKSISNCNFEHRLSLCDNYKNKDILGTEDFLFLNKKLQIISKIATYVISLFGIVTNLLVVLVILYKNNTESFKEFKQYSYLWLISLFSILILSIEMLSWITECFFPFEVFCPDIRKLVAFQFFKVILVECLIPAFRFMCSFCYVAFALNRISLIGKDHGKIVEFMSKAKVKYYILITLVISLGLSVIKYFKYEINYDELESTFPISNEWNILIDSYLKSSNLAYFIINSISDLLNYVVFVVVCFILDVCMVVQLRKTLNEKFQKQKSILNPAQAKTKKKENDEVVKRSVKMVVLNTAIGIVLKMPSSFLPVVNLCADSYFRHFNQRYKHPAFGEFYSTLIDGEFYGTIEDFSKFLYCFSLSIQFFIYLIFDKKFKTGYDNFKNKKSNNAKVS